MLSRSLFVSSLIAVNFDIKFPAACELGISTVILNVPVSPDFRSVKVSLLWLTIHLYGSSGSILTDFKSFDPLLVTEN